MEQAFENAPTFEIAFVNIVSPAALSYVDITRLKNTLELPYEDKIHP